MITTKTIAKKARITHSLVMILSLSATSAAACTSIGFAGNAVEHGGTILAKDRDASGGKERLELIKPKDGFSYLALTYSDKTTDKYQFIAAGTNEYGLSVVVNDPVTHLPRGRNINRVETMVMKEILSKYKTVDAVKAHAASIFGSGNPALFEISDHQKVANFEGGYHGLYGQRITANGYIWNTNHYHLPSVIKQNQTWYQSSIVRGETIRDLLTSAQYPISFGDVTLMLDHRAHGFQNSIRNSLQAAQYVVQTPVHGAPKVFVEFTLPSQPYNEYAFTLSPELFTKSAGPIQGHSILS